MWRSPEGGLRVPVWSSRSSPRKFERQTVAERGAQRSTVRPCATRVRAGFPQTPLLARTSRLCIAKPAVGPYTGGLPPPARSLASTRARPPRGGLFVEAHLSAQQPQAVEDSRLSRPHEHAGRTSRAAHPSGPRAQAALRLIWRIRDRATFEALARAPRHRAGALSLRYVASTAGVPPRVAYTVGRQVGNAVERNRLRRRLRAVVAAHEAELQRGGAYLLGAERRAMTLDHTSVDTAVSELLRAVRGVSS